jgi:hypothetical protein
MSINSFYSSLLTKVDECKDCFPQEALSPIQHRLQELQRSDSQQKPRDEVIESLFDLSVFVQKQASTFRIPVLSDIFGDLITEKISQIASTALSASSSVPAKTPSCASVACAGLRNTSNKCYLYSCLKGLWASEKFRKIIERKAIAIEGFLAPGKKEGAKERRCTALFLYRLFLTFDATVAGEVIEPDERPLQELLKEMAKYHPSIMDGKQQDSTEFLSWLWDDVFEDGECLFRYIVI